MEPPPCVQNAMMKQDKKPFTYTPGGIDLSEIKSPRMARRIERNANWDGVSEAPRAQPPAQNVGPLPPSALAAMQPQMHVQVFPSGPPPPPPSVRNAEAPPPPPPPPNGKIPPPPPPPLQPLPTQKVVTSDNHVVERPDMTKIIPDNPMALLKKTGGPKPRPTLFDEFNSKANQPSQMRSPPIREPKSFPNQTPSIQPSQQQTPQSPIQTPPLQRPRSFVEEMYNTQPNQTNNQWSPQPQQNHQFQQPRSPQPQKPQQWSPPIIERQVEQPVKTSTAHIGSLYIPPATQQQQQLQQRPQPPTPPKRDPQSPQAQSPSTPTLKDAPKPWQKQQQHSQELPPWAKKETVAPPPSQIQQEQSPPVQPYRAPPNRWSNQGPASPKQEQQPEQQQSAPNVVYVTQPLVFQHPGTNSNRQSQQQPPQQQRQSQQLPRVDAQGAKIIPVQIERPASKVNSPATPVTPASERSFNRQQSWTSTPTQSNAFKIIQKITQTDNDDENGDQPVTEHGPRYPQQFQQQIPADQMRKMKLAEGDRELMNKFKQGVGDETYLHNEIDPRYRGAAIPSKAFKLLQSMTDGTTDNSTTPSVSRGPVPTSNKQPQVRTIPIQIEREETPQKHVPPSEQTVPEPKKYTGSAIPSRSFKILQAMTAPETCANANEVNENFDPSSYNQWNYDPNYPPPPFSSFWSDYYYYYYLNQPNNNDCNNNNINTKENDERNNRQTPVPFWGYYPPPPLPPPPFMQRQYKPSDTESDSDTPRSTPLPFWGGYFPPYCAPTPVPDRENCCQDYQMTYPQYPPYWDPYYYRYYFGYPPYPFYTTPSDAEDTAGYSSTEERTHFARQSVDRSNEKSISRATTPKILVTPTTVDEIIPEQNQKQVVEEDDKVSSSYFSSSESDSETEVEEDDTEKSRAHGLQAIKSVTDINIYDYHSDDEQNMEETSEETDSASIYIVEDDTIPHQLSIIFEESERTDISKRETSILSDSTTIADRTDNEEEDAEEEEEEEEEISISISLPLRTTKESEITASFTLKTPESSRTVSRLEEHNNEDNEDEENMEESKGKEEKGDSNENEGNKREDDDEQDWWGIINKDEDDFYPRQPKMLQETYEETAENCEASKETAETIVYTSNNDEDDETSSSSSSDSSSSESSVSKASELKEEKIEEEEKEQEAVAVEIQGNKTEMIRAENDSSKEDENVKLLTIKERIQALRQSIRQKQMSINDEDEEIKISVKEKVSAIENSNVQNKLTITTTTTSTKSSVKSFEELSEEEGDSGVTSDMSRHISDNEEFPELRKMSRYQRAATHSRLYKLLQEECEDEDDNDVKDKDVDEDRRHHLSLPLETTNFDVDSNQPSSINETLIDELVESMLKRKKGQNFRHLPKEKLQSAAKRILQEEFDDLSLTPDSSFLSPLRNNTESSTPAQTPQEFYNDYKQYYETWNDYGNDIDSSNDNNDVFPSKTFKLLQEHSTGLNRTGAIAGLLAKCPKILSSKNVHQELIKLIEQYPDNQTILDTNHDAS